MVPALLLALLVLSGSAGEPARDVETHQVLQLRAYTAIWAGAVTLPAPNNAPPNQPHDTHSTHTPTFTHSPPHHQKSPYLGAHGAEVPGFQYRYTTNYKYDSNAQIRYSYAPDTTEECAKLCVKEAGNICKAWSFCLGGSCNLWAIYPTADMLAFNAKCTTGVRAASPTPPASTQDTCKKAASKMFDVDLSSGEGVGRARMHFRRSAQRCLHCPR